VYIDEFGFNLGTLRHFGRAPAGQLAIQLTPANHGANVSVVAAIQKGFGILYYKAQKTAFKAATFTACVQEILQQLAGQEVCFVMDNCRVHDKEELPGVLEEAGHSLKFVPPYSPMLNPIEEVIGDVKREIRKLLSGEYHQEVLGIQALAWGEKTRAREELLLRVLDVAISAITVEAVDKHWGHSFSFLSDALQSKPL
jgi:transposase